MSSVAEIEQAIAGLSREQFAELERWFNKQRNLLWDREIEEDAASGKLRKFYKTLEAENRGQPGVPLNEFLDEQTL